MRRYLTVLWCVLVGTAAAMAFPAQDAAKSGPQVGQLVPGPFQAFNATGPYAGRPHCLVCQHGLHPVVLVFARDPGETDGPVMKLVKALDDAVEKYRAADLNSFVVFLNDEVQNVDSRRVLVKRLQDLADGLKLKHVVLALDRAAGPKDYNINKEFDVTALLYHKHAVVGNIAVKKDELDEKKIAEILEAVGKMVPAKKK
jgi:hypothetical protein